MAKNPLDDLTKQLKLSTGLANVFRKALHDTFEEVESDQQRVSRGFKSMGNDLKQNVIKHLEGFHSVLKGVPKTLVALSGAVKGFKISLGLMGTGLKLAKGLFQAVASTALGLADIVVNNLFKAFNKTYSTLKTTFSVTFKYLRGGLREWITNHWEVLRATEAMRGTFGDLGEGIGKAAMDFAGGAGVVGRIGGRFQETLNIMREVLTGVGASFEQMAASMSSKQRKAIGSTLVILGKGLGLSGQQIEGLARMSLVTGEAFQSLSDRLMKGVVAVSSLTGIAKKTIAKDVITMIDDVNTFGIQTIESATTTTARLRTLGVEIKQVAGMVKKFDTFKDAAISVGLLTQAFNMQFDAYAMMREEDPAKRIDMLRQSFFAAGKSVESLSRQELSFLATQTGLDMKTAELVFSLKNQGKSYKTIQEEAKKSKSPQEKMVGVMRNMEKTLARILTYFKPYETFMDAFNEGMRRGLALSKSGAGLFRNYEYTLQNVMETTQRLVEWSLDNIPGLNVVWKEMTKALELKESKKFLEQFEKATKSFVDNNMITWDIYSETLSREWDKIYGEGSSKRIIDGFKTMGKMIIKSLSQLINYVTPKLASFAQELADGITGANKPGGFFSKDSWYHPLLLSLSEAWETLKTPLWNLLKATWEYATEKAWPALRDGFSNMWKENREPILQELKWMWNWVIYEAWPVVKDELYKGFKDLPWGWILGSAALITTITGSITALGHTIATKLMGAVVTKLTAGITLKGLALGIGATFLEVTGIGLLAAAVGGFAYYLTNTLINDIPRKLGVRGFSDIIADWISEDATETSANMAEKLYGSQVTRLTELNKKLKENLKLKGKVREESLRELKIKAAAKAETIREKFSKLAIERGEAERTQTGLQFASKEERDKFERRIREHVTAALKKGGFSAVDIGEAYKLNMKFKASTERAVKEAKVREESLKELKIKAAAEAKTIREKFSKLAIERGEAKRTQTGLQFASKEEGDKFERRIREHVTATLKKSGFSAVDISEAYKLNMKLKASTERAVKEAKVANVHAVKSIKTASVKAATTEKIMQNHEARVVNVSDAFKKNGVMMGSEMIKGNKGNVTLVVHNTLQIDGQNLSDVLASEYGISNTYKGIEKGPGVLEAI
ncbi:hypothetical protein CMI47_11860 [Candidatus Pacearchaeota archaeon]|nr:hypothetical protein [Candidatus Pacearchaeota archaeon]